MGCLVPLTRRTTQLVPRPQHRTRMGERQLDLVLDDVLVRVTTATERRTVVMTLARLLLEAGGVTIGEVGDDNV
jgi:hypothetical protein